MQPLQMPSSGRIVLCISLTACSNFQSLPWPTASLKRLSHGPFLGRQVAPVIIIDTAAYDDSDELAEVAGEKIKEKCEESAGEGI